MTGTSSVATLTEPARPTLSSGAFGSARRLGYFVNQYPKVSHSFIRREILALERRGMAVRRYALRGWDAPLVDAADERERGLTAFLLRNGVTASLGAFMRRAVTHPRQAWAGLKLTWRLARGSNRSLALHAVSLCEAALLAQWAERDGVAHIHAHFGTNSAEVVLLARALGGPTYSLTIHGSEEWDQPRQLKLREKIAGAAFVAAISSHGRAQLMRWADGADVDKLQVVHCGLDQAFLAGNWPLAPDAPRLVSIGRLCVEKAPWLLVQAIGQLKRDGVPVHLVLAGDGELRAQVEEVIAREDVADRVSITGWIDGARVREELLAARASVLASLVEGLPVVLMESLALRRPVIAPWITGIPELVRDEQEGWLFAPGSVSALAQAIRHCLDAPIERVRTMGDQGRERVLERHDVDTEVDKLEALLRDALSPSAEGQAA
jgi:glycosyltransferase involved in cell wall biosynthesis